MKAILKLLTAIVITAVSICIPLYASESPGDTSSPQSVSDAFFPDIETVEIVNVNNNQNTTIVTLTRNAENHNLYEGSIEEPLVNDAKFEIRIGNIAYKVSNNQYYCVSWSNPANVPLPNTSFEFCANQYAEFMIGNFPYSKAKFTVEVTGENTVNLTIAEVLPEAPAAGSSIEVKNKNGSAVLTNSAENPYIFKGTLSSVAAYSNIDFFYNGKSYGLDQQYWEKDLPEGEIVLSQGKTGVVHYDNENPIDNLDIEVTLSKNLMNMTVKFKQRIPAYVIINGVEKEFCDNINNFATGDVIEIPTPVSVDKNSSTTVAIKIGDKTYGVDANTIVFDADNRQEQVHQAPLVEKADAVTLDQKGVYTIAIALESDGRKLQITKAAAGNEMYFGEGNALVFDDKTNTWEGAVSFKANQVLPGLTYTVYDEDGSIVSSNTYWFTADIDDPDGHSGKSVELSTEKPEKNFKCVTSGTYSLIVTIDAEGKATAAYRNTNPPVEIKDLMVCLYDRNLNSKGAFGYDAGDSSDHTPFTVDYPVTYRHEDGSYAIALPCNPYQTFYIMNNGIAYRPSAADCAKPFGEGAEFTFTASEDHQLRKYVSKDGGYRMLTITPDGSNLKVKGYVMTVTAKNSMAIIRSLSKPDNKYKHMADVFVKFTNPDPDGDPDNTKGYRTDYCRMNLNPSGTHGLYDLQLKAGQTFEIYRGRAIYGEDGETVIGIEEEGKVQYGCEKLPAAGESSVTITDGDISTLYDPHIGPCNTKTYSVVRDGEFSFVVFYTTMTKQLTVSRKVNKDRGIKIAVYDKNGNQQGDLVDMQYKNRNRRNLMSVQVPKDGYVKFGFPNKKGEFVPFKFYNLGHSNEVGYDTKPAEGAQQDEQFDAISADYTSDNEKVWYRFRIRLREDGNYYLTYQKVPMPKTVYLYVTVGDEEMEYEASAADSNKPGHFVFKNVTIPEGAEYYFVNTKGGAINPDWSVTDKDPANGLIWYSAHSSTLNNGGAQEGNPVSPGRWINMFSHLNVGTDYQGTYKFSKFKYSGRTLNNIEVDMDIASMSHRYSVDYTGSIYYFSGNCANIQGPAGVPGWNGNSDERYRFVYHPTTGYYTCYLEYLWGDWFIWNYNDEGQQQIKYSPFNINNVIHELNRPYYLSDGDNRYISDFKKMLPTGTAANTKLTFSDLNGDSYKDRFMISMAPGAEAIIQTNDFQYDWVQSPVYKDVTVVFDPANNVLWLMSGHTDGEAGVDDPYGELYLVFTDVEPDKWAEDRKTDKAGATKGHHWVKLERDPDHVGRYTATGIPFPPRQLDANGDKKTTHSSYFFSNRLGNTLAETIRYSNSYHAGLLDPKLPTQEETVALTTEDEELYGSVFTKLVYNEAGDGGKGSFETEEEPMALINADRSAYASVVYVRRWDNKYGAPFEDCVVPGSTQKYGQASRHAQAKANVDDNVADNGSESGSNGVEGTPDKPVYVTTTDDEPDNVAATDLVLRTFASEPYTYDVTVHLGREKFTLVTTPRNLIHSGVEDLAVDAPSNTVIRATAGHITVTGANSVSIYTVSGRCLLLNAPGADMDVAPGVYIIVADGQASKHILR